MSWKPGRFASERWKTLSPVLCTVWRGIMYPAVMQRCVASSFSCSRTWQKSCFDIPSRWARTIQNHGGAVGGALCLFTPCQDGKSKQSSWRLSWLHRGWHLVPRPRYRRNHALPNVSAGQQQPWDLHRSTHLMWPQLDARLWWTKIACWWVDACWSSFISNCTSFSCSVMDRHCKWQSKAIRLNLCQCCSLEFQQTNWTSSAYIWKHAEQSTERMSAHLHLSSDVAASQACKLSMTQSWIKTKAVFKHVLNPAENRNRLHKTLQVVSWDLFVSFEGNEFKDSCAALSLLRAIRYGTSLEVESGCGGLLWTNVQHLFPKKLSNAPVMADFQLSKQQSAVSAASPVNTMALLTGHYWRLQWPGPDLQHSAGGLPGWAETARPLEELKKPIPCRPPGSACRHDSRHCQHAWGHRAWKPVPSTSSSVGELIRQTKAPDTPCQKPPVFCFWRSACGLSQKQWLAGRKLMENLVFYSFLKFWYSKPW